MKVRFPTTKIRNIQHFFEKSNNTVMLNDDACLVRDEMYK